MPATATPARPAPPAPSLARRSPAQRALFLVLAYGIRRLSRRRGLLFVERVTGLHWSWAGSLGLGVGLMAWIVVQRLLIPGTMWLQPFYFSVGAAIAALTLTRSVGANLRASD